MQFKRSVIAILCLVSLAACTSPADSGNTPTGRYTPVDTSTTGSSTPSTDSTTSGPSAQATGVPYDPRVTPPPRGANAAPGAVRSPSSIYDSSSAAEQNFSQWWNYEIQVPQDNQPFNNVYTAGVSVCAQRARNVSIVTIENVVMQEFGFTRSGAAGITKAALSALCPWRDLGYKTFFDRNTETMMMLIAPKITFKQQPPFYHFGFFMKETCAALALKGGSAIYDHMASQANNLELMENGTIPEQVRRIYIKAAVQAGCSSLFTHLPPVIQQA